MCITDFKYDGRYLKDFGFTVCSFGKKTTSAETQKTGSVLTFNTVYTNRGLKHNLVGTKYATCIKVEFDICKCPDMFDDLKITDDEFIELSRWLNRNKFYKIEFFDDDEDSVNNCRYYEASFNLYKIQIGHELYGVHLEMHTNSPFAFGAEEVVSFQLAEDNEYKKIINNKSDNTGYLFPTLSIICEEDGDFEISSFYDNKKISSMYFTNCKQNEKITIDGKTLSIQSSLSVEEHDINNNFNYDFLKLYNEFGDRRNVITSNKKCTIELKYTPIFKIAP